MIMNNINMPDIIKIINNLTNYFNSKNIKFVVSGSVAIKYLCELYSVENNIKINNLDIYYLANTPITNEYIQEYHRVQTAPHSSLSYETKDGFKINLTMTRSHRMKYIDFNNIKLMHPNNLVSFYEDDNENINSAEKLDVLNELNLITDDFSDLYIHKDDIHNENTSSIESIEPIEPLSKRFLFP